MVKTLSGVTNFTVSDTLKVKKVSANNSLGTNGQVLTTNGSATYWSTPVAETTVNTNAQYVWTNTHTHASGLYLNNDVNLYFKTVNTAAAVSFRQQADDNFVFYSTSTSYGNRPVFSVFANSITSNLQIHVPLQLNSGLVANGSLGTAGQVLHTNGTTTYWAADDVNVNTTYDLLAIANTTTNQGIIRLKDVNNSNDDVYLTGAGGVVVSSNASHILITGAPGDITGVNAGDGLTGNTASGEATIAVLPNTGIIANATGTYVNAAYIATIASNTANYANASYTNTFTVGTATYFVSNGNVGIGTNSPTSPLHVTSATFPVARMERSTSLTSGSRSSFASVHKTTGDMANSFGTDISFIIRDSSNVDNEIANFGAYRDGADNSGTLIFATYNAGAFGVKMYIKPDGSVGIGNAVPSHLLSVNGTSYFGANVTLNAALLANGSPGSAGQVLKTTGSGVYWAADTDNNTTYDLLAVANTAANEGRIRLKDSANANDDVLVTGTGAAVVSSNATHVIINATDTNTTYDLLTVANTEANKAIIRLTDSNSANDNAFVIGANGVTAFSNSSGVYAYAVGSNTVTVNTAGIHVNPSLSITDLTLSGNLTVSGNVTVIGANTLSIVDNFIYLNANNTTQNIDLGFAGNYNDGTYKHAGFFRDASDGYWKVFDGYTPEPDANVNIDTTNTTFNIANFWAGAIRLGNTSVYSTINSTSFSGTSNNANFANVATYVSTATTTNTFTVGTATYFNSNGQVLIGSSTPEPGIGGGVGGGKLQVHGSGFDTFSVFANSDTQAPSIRQHRKRATGGTVQAGDVTSIQQFAGWSGTNYRLSGRIVAAVDSGTISDTSMPGYITFDTTPNGSVTPVERIRITQSGNVGIGLNNPSYNLHVSGDIAASSRAYIGSASNAGQVQLLYGTVSQFALNSGIGGVSNFSISDILAGSERLRINSTGAVGIGTSSPGAKLHVIGDGFFEADSTAGAQLQVRGATNSNNRVYFGYNTSDNTGRIQAITEGTAYRNLILQAGGGNVGIGTASPTGKLHAFISNTAQLIFQNVSQNNLYVSGVNASVVVDSSSGSFYPSYQILQNGSYVGAFGADATNSLSITAGTPYPIVFNTQSGVERMRITSAGNVGIGTTSPSTRLHVADTQAVITAQSTGAGAAAKLDFITPWNGVDYTASISNDWVGAGFLFKTSRDLTNSQGGFVFQSAAGTNSMVIRTNSGNIGIGTDTPSEKLQVQGNALITSNNFVGPNTAFGIQIHRLNDINYIRSNGGNGTAELQIGSENNSTTKVYAHNGGVWLQPGPWHGSNDYRFTAATFTKQLRDSVNAATDHNKIDYTYTNNVAGNISSKIVYSINEKGSWVNYLTAESVNGNVGIGNNSPTEKLVVQGNIRLASAGYITGGATDSGNNEIIAGVDSTGFFFAGGFNRAPNTLPVNIGGTTGDIRFRTLGTEKIRFAANGNVGIGTSSPITELHIKGVANGDEDLLLLDGAQTGTGLTGILFRNNGSPVNSAAIRGGPTVEDPGGGRSLTFWGNASGTLTERMRIDNSGNLGVGIKTPISKIQSTLSGNGSALMLSTTLGGTGTYVDLDFLTYAQTSNGYANPAATIRAIDDGTFSNHITFRTKGSTVGASQTERMRIAANGNIGIGTVSPNALLTLDATSPRISFYPSDSSYALYRSSTSMVLNSPGYTEVSSAAGTNLTATTGAIAFNTGAAGSASERMRVAANGNVGIATTTPGFKLEVNGTGYASGDFRAPIFYDSANTSFYVDPAGVSNLYAANIGALGWNSIVPTFGQRSMYLNELTDLLYLADRRFTVSNGSSVYFDGNYDSSAAIPVNTTRVININIAGQSGIPASGITYCGGVILISFYYTAHAYSSLSLRVKNSSGVWTSAATPTNISTSSSFKVMAFDVPIYNYLTDIELTVVTDATNEVSIAAINYYVTRWTNEVELPFASKYLTSNYMFGDFGVKTNSNVINNLLSGTGNSYLAANTGNVGIGTTTATKSLTVKGTGLAVVAGGTQNAGNEIYFYRSDLLNMAYIGWQTPTSANSPWLFNSVNGNPIVWASGGTERMRLTDPGSLGIGTSSPSRKLHIVANTAGVDGILIDNPNNGVGVGVETAIELYNASNFMAKISSFRDTNELRIANPQTGIASFYTANTERMRITSAGDVGIGTNSPLNYAGYTSLTIGSTTSVGLIKLRSSYNSGNGAEIYQGPGGSTYFTTNSSSTWMLSDSTGKVGIGTTSPAARLDIGQSAGTFGTGNLIFASTYSNVQHLRMYMDGNWTTHIQSVQAGANVSALAFGTNSTEYMRISNTGNVGIGTTTPSTKLEVVGKTRLNFSNLGTDFLSLYNGVGNESIIRATASTSTYNGLYLINNATGLTTQANTALPSWFVDIGGTAADGTSFKTGTSDTFRVGRIAGNGNFLTTDASLTITNTGNVGIGTTTPSGPLHVSGAIFPVALIERKTDLTTGMRSTFVAQHTTTADMTDGFGADISFRIRDNAGVDNEIALFGARRDGADNSGRLAFYSYLAGVGAENMTIKSDGNVGIGTTTPNRKLTIGNSGVIGLYDTGNANQATLQMAASGFEQYVGASKYIAFGTDATERMRITANGNVGIGTTTPSVKLDVNGEIRVLSISGYNLSNNAATIDTGLTPADFTILEAFGSANPNSDGSSNYRDPIHLYIYRGTGWNGSAVTEYVYAQSVAPPARSAFPSGSGSSVNDNMSVVWVKAGVESDTCPLNDSTYSLRIKISNYTTTSYFSLRIVRRF